MALRNEKMINAEQMKLYSNDVTELKFALKQEI